MVDSISGHDRQHLLVNALTGQQLKCTIYS